MGFQEEPLNVGGMDIVPREFFHTLLLPRIQEDTVRDVGIIRVRSVGEKDGEGTKATIELIDRFDERTGLSAMQKLTGWHASIIAILAARGELPRGAVPVERAVSGEVMVREARRRGFEISENIRKIE